MNPASLAGHVLELIGSIDRGTAPADRVMAAFFRNRGYCGARDRRFISDATIGIIRNRRFLEALLEEFISRHSSAAALDAPINRYLALLTAYLFILEPGQTGITPLHWKTVFPTTDLGRYLDWLGLNRGLEFLPDDPVIRLGVTYSFQDWMTSEWHDRLGEDTAALLGKLNTPARTTLRVNTLKTTRAECMSRLEREGLDAEPTMIAPDGLIARGRFNARSIPAFVDGWFEIQDEGSQLISLIADPKPGETVIDAAAGAGGKSLQMAAMMQNRGTLISGDIDRERLRTLAERKRRAAAEMITIAEAGALPGAGEYGPADLVLLDVPCSGTGTIRRNPWLKWTLRESHISRYHELQSAMIADYARLVRQGGRMVYSTCSLFRSENEDVISGFLEDHPGFRVVPSTGMIRPELAESGLGYTIFPHRLNTDGFFAAVLHRDE